MFFPENGFPVKTDRTLRAVLYEYYNKHQNGKELPIRGGWGYSQEDAIVIDKKDPVVNPKIPFDMVNMEYFLVEKRVFCELIHFQAPGHDFCNIHWNVKSQNVLYINERRYDKLSVSVLAVLVSDWNRIRHQAENSPKFLVALLGVTHRYISDYWFDISCC